MYECKNAAVSVNEQFHAVLRVASHQGVQQFLSSTDLVALHGTCRLCHQDDELAVGALLRNPYGCHLLHECPEDLFETMYERHGECERCQSRSLSTREVIVALQKRGVKLQLGSLAALFSEIAFITRRVARWCFTYDTDSFEESEDLLCRVQPVVLAVPEGCGQPNGATSTIAKAVYGGSLEVHKGPHSARTRFAAHWDAITVDENTGRIACSLCTQVKRAVILYRHKYAHYQQRYEEVLQSCRAKWRDKEKTTDDVEALTQTLKDLYFCGGFFEADGGSWSDERILCHLVNCEDPSLPSTLRGMSYGEVVKTFSHKYRHQCRTFYTPMKRHFLEHFKRCFRVPLQTSGSDEVPIMREFVGGVCHSLAVISGVSVTFKLGDRP